MWYNVYVHVCIQLGDSTFFYHLEKYYEAIGITPEKADTSRLSAMLFHRARAALGGKLLATKMDLKQHKGM
jgi:hypothetical protein